MNTSLSVLTVVSFVVCIKGDFEKRMNASLF